MSIRDEIQRLEREGKLFCLESACTGEDTVRTLWVSVEVFEAVTQPSDHLLYEFRQFLDAWLENGHFTVAEDPDNKLSDAMLARVKPVDQEFWDFRVTAPAPGIRAFGGFAEYDTFIILTWEYRADILDRQFDIAVERCMDEWHQLFGAVAPFKGGRLDEYLSNFSPV